MCNSDNVKKTFFNKKVFFIWLKIKKFKKPFIILKKSAIIYNNDYCAENFIMED